MNEVNATELAKNNYKDYAIYVNSTRALASIYDGLKDVQRRIIYAANAPEFNRITKSAELEGAVMKYHPHGCIIGSTEFYSLELNKFISIEDMYNMNISKDNKFYTINTNKYRNTDIGEISKVWITKYVTKLFKIKLSNGSYIRCTGNHPILLSNNEYVNAENIKVGDALYTSVIEGLNNEPSITATNPKHNKMILQDRVREKYVSYYIKGYHIHHKNFNHLNNHPENIQYISPKEHANIHKNNPLCLEGLNKGRNSMFNGYLKKANCNKNHKLISEYNKNQGLFRAIKIVEDIINDNLEVNECNYNLYRSKVYNGITLDKIYSNGYTLNDLKNMAFKKKITNYSRDYKLWNDKESDNKRHNVKRKKISLFKLYVESIEIENYENPIPVYDFEEDNNHNSFIHTGSINGIEVLSCIHNSSYGAIVNLACPINNLPLFDIQGNFGGFNCGASASRYTACRLSDIARFIYCQFMDYAPMISGEIGKLEPKYLPCLIPYSLIEGSNGIGVGLSSDGIPLNIIDLINYYIYYIQNEEFNMDLIPKPEFGASVIMQDDSEWKSNMSQYNGSIIMHPIITQESDNIFVIKSLYGTNIDSLLKKLRWYIDNDKVDFRNETKLHERYVFEIVDKSVIPEDFKRDLIKFTTKKIHHNRVLTKDGVSIYCGINYVIDNQLKALNEAIDRKLSIERDKILKKSRLLRVLSFYKTTSVFNNLSSKSREDLIYDMLSYNNEESDYDLCKEIISKPITYLTKDHDNELDELSKQLQDIDNHNRKEYLISLYTELKDMVSDLYNSRIHTMTQNSLITNPRAYLNNDKLIIKGKGKGIKFKNTIYLITKNSCVIKKSLSSDSESVIDNINSLLWDENDKFVAICSDFDDYIELICNDNTRLVFSVKSYKYDKKIINLKENQEVVKCNGYTEKDFPEDMRYLVKSKISKSLK